MDPVVVGIDFSRPSRLALDAAVALAKQLGSGVVVVHALSPLPPGAKDGHLDPVSQLRVELDADEVNRLGQTWVAEASRQVAVELVARIGRPADVLLDEARARRAPYVVVGSHGRTGLRKVILGSVAQAVVKGSAVPVLVVPGGLA